MDDDDLAPIEEQPYIFGQVIDLDGIRIARGKSKRPSVAPKDCQHDHLVYDQDERRVWCKDCEKSIASFDAFLMITRNFMRFARTLTQREQAVEKAEAHALISRAAKAVDESWRRRKLSPCCPHCNGAILPEDFAEGIGSYRSTEIERQRRKSKGSSNA
jgi:hypothetical protein